MEERETQRAKQCECIPFLCLLEETDINEENSNATSTVKNDHDTSKDVSTMSYKEAVVNRG